MRNDHAVKRTGSSGRRREKIGVAIQIDQADVAIVASRSGDRSEGHRRVAGENHRKRAGLYGFFDFGLERFDGGQHTRKIARAGAFFILLVKARGAVAEVDDVITDGAEAIRETRGPQSGGCAFLPGRKSCGASRRA